jgi:hypothetical protein
MVNPLLGEVIAITELLVALTVVAVALFDPAPDHLTDLHKSGVSPAETRIGSLVVVFG